MEKRSRKISKKQIAKKKGCILTLYELASYYDVSERAMSSYLKEDSKNPELKDVFRNYKRGRLIPPNVVRFYSDDWIKPEVN